MSMKQKLVGMFKKGVSTAFLKRREWKMLRSVEKLIRENDEPVPPLTEQQIRDAKAFWKQWGIDTPVQWHRFLTAKTGTFRPDFVAEPVFHWYIKDKLNDAKFRSVWGDKAYTDYFLRDVRTAECVIRNVNGRFLNHDFELIDIETAQKIMDSYPQLVVKPATCTDTGKGVALLTSPYDLRMIHKQYCKNYVIQLPLKQHPGMCKLNESSINTIRVNSVLLGTEAYVMSAFVKVGQAGEFADNHGHQRYFIGIQEDGAYMDYAIDHDLKKYDRIPSGFVFAGEKIPCFDRVCETVRKAHKCIPHFGFAFWDVCVCEDGEPAVVEVNLRYPDAVIPQVAVGPFLGKYTPEIMAYVASEQERIS